MSVNSFQIRLCQSCGLRYPLAEDHPFGDRCPSCLGTTKPVSTHRLRPKPASPPMESKIQLEVLLDNIRSAWNVGSIFRTADGLGIRKLYLCGITPTPQNDSVHKTSLGAEETVAWEYSRNALETAIDLKNKGFALIALEQDEHAKTLSEFRTSEIDSQKSVLIVGNEVTGVDPELLHMCDQILYIPMRGHKHSLNVEVAFGIAAYQLTAT